MVFNWKEKCKGTKVDCKNKWIDFVKNRYLISDDDAMVVNICSKQILELYYSTFILTYVKNEKGLFFTVYLLFVIW